MGTNDEIIDLRFLGEQDSHIAVASSSETVRIYDLETLNCSMIFGHTDIIICMDAGKDGQNDSSPSHPLSLVLLNLLVFALDRHHPGNWFQGQASPHLEI